MLREPNALLMSLVFPLLLYPIMVLVGAELYSFVSASQEGERFRVALVEVDEQRAGERLLLELEGDFERYAGAGLPEAALRLGAVDALLEVSVNAAGGIDAAIRSDGTRSRSRRCADALARALRRERELRVTEVSRALGVSPGKWQVSSVQRDAAGPEGVMGFLLSMLLPQALVLMGMITTMYPAVEAVVGERERSTLETVMVTAIPRGALILGKLGCVLLVSVIGVAANLVALLLTLRHLVVLLELDLSFAVALGATEILAFFGLALLATTVSAGANLVAALPTRSFKQAQNAASAVVSVAAVLAMLGGMESARLDGTFAWLPYSGLILLMRGIINQEALAALDVVTVIGLHLGLAALLFAVAVMVVRRESWWVV